MIPLLSLCCDTGGPTRQLPFLGPPFLGRCPASMLMMALSCIVTLSLGSAKHVSSMLTEFLHRARRRENALHEAGVCRGFHAHLVKPIDPVELAATIADLSVASRQEDALLELQPRSITR